MRLYANVKPNVKLSFFLFFFFWFDYARHHAPENYFKMLGRRCTPVAKLMKPAPNVVYRLSYTRQFGHSQLLSSPHLETELSAPNGTRWTQPLGLFINNQFSESIRGDKIATTNP